MRMNRRIFALIGAPIFIGAISANAAPKAKLPLVVYDNAGRDNLPYIPSGYMGNTHALNVDDGSRAHPHSGATCMQVTVSAKDWAGVVWQSPADDWGNKPGRWNLAGAKKLTFWARGQ